MPATKRIAVSSARPYCSGKRTGRRGAIDLRRSRRHIGHTVGVQDAFGYVLFGVVIIGVIAAVATFFMTGKAYDQIGKGGFYRDDSAPSGGGSINIAERDDEIRQM